MPKYIAFLYLGEENVYIYSTSSDNYETIVKDVENKDGVWTVIYEYETTDHYGYSSCERYAHKINIKGKNTKGYLAPTPMNYVSYFPIALDKDQTIFTHKWFWQNC